MPEEISEKARKIMKPHWLPLIAAEFAFAGFVVLVNTQPQKPGASLLFFLAMTLCVLFFAVHEYRESKYQIRGYEICTLTGKEHEERRNGQGRTHFYFLTVRTSAGSVRLKSTRDEYKMNQENTSVYVVTICNDYTKRENSR